jgi:hypothetical protein
MSQEHLTEARLLEILDEVQANAQGAGGQGGMSAHADGLTFQRARALVLNPSRWTPEERAHVAQCRRCARLIDNFEQNMVHPSLGELFSWLVGDQAGEDVQPLRYHLENGECQQCLRLIKSPLLGEQVGRFRNGRGIPDHVRALFGTAVTGFAPLAAPVGAFEGATRPPFQLRAVNPDGSLTVTVRETDEGDLAASVQTPDGTLAGRTVRVELLGAGEPVTAELLLEPQGEDGCTGRHNFGPFAQLAPCLGAGFAVLASPTDAPPRALPQQPGEAPTTFR